MVPRESRIEKEQVRISSVKPLQLVGIGEDGAVCLAAIGLVLFLRVNAVKLRRLIAPRSKGAEVDVGRAVSRHRGDAELGEEVNAVRGRGDTDGLDVFDCETDQVGVAEVFLLYVSLVGNDAKCVGCVPQRQSTQAHALVVGRS